MNLRKLILAVLISGLTSAVALAQANNPLVSMTITLPGGETQDSKPWTHVVVAIFKTPTPLTRVSSSVKSRSRQADRPWRPRPHQHSSWP
jgi:hypothetical protein